MNIPSLKKMLITDLYYIPAMEGLEKTKLFVITALGVITGTPVFSDNGKNTGVGLADVITKMADEHIDKYYEGSEMPGDDGYFFLQNAELKTSSNATFHFEQLIIFF